MMTRIGITVSGARQYPHHLDVLRPKHTLISINPNELVEKIDQCEILYVWNLTLNEVEDALKLKEHLPHSIYIAQQGETSSLNSLAQERNISIKYAHGVFSKTISEFILASILILQKNLHKTTSRHEWIKNEQRKVSATKALILGRGSIAKYSTELLQKVGISTNIASKQDVFELIHKNSHKTYKDIDHIVCCLPLEEDSEKILNDKFFCHFENANFINISRGKLLETKSLTNALNHGYLRAAVLDALDPEPLPKDHHFWLDDRIVVSPHQSYRSPEWDYLLHRSFIKYVESLS